VAVGADLRALTKILLPGRLGRPRKRSQYIVADKGYGSDALRHYCTCYGLRPITLRQPKLNLIEILWRQIKYYWLLLGAYLSFDRLCGEVQSLALGLRFGAHD